MSILFFKSILSLFMIVAAMIAMFTMFEIYGRSTQKYDSAKLKMIHRVNGIIYFILFLFIAYYCVKFIMASKMELSPRATFHSIFALTILLLFALKASFIRFYRQFYGQAKLLGILIALITFGMVGTSGIYYLLVTEFGSSRNFDKIMKSKMEGSTENIEDKDEEGKIKVMTDPESISRGKSFFEENCSFCHDPHSTKTTVGPGLIGVLKNQTLPVSKKPATPENIAKQLKNPYDRMPSFSHLQENEILDIIAFLNTL